MIIGAILTGLLGLSALLVVWDACNAALEDAHKRGYQSHNTQETPCTEQTEPS